MLLGSERVSQRQKQKSLTPYSSSTDLYKRLSIGLCIFISIDRENFFLALIRRDATFDYPDVYNILNFIMTEETNSEYKKKCSLRELSTGPEGHLCKPQSQLSVTHCQESESTVLSKLRNYCYSILLLLRIMISRHLSQIHSKK